VDNPWRRSCRCVENETGSRLPVEDRKVDIVGETAELHEPLAGGGRLPPLTAPVVAFHHLARRHPDRVEVETTYSGDSAGAERVDRGGLSSARGAGDDEDPTNGHAALFDRVNPSCVASFGGVTVLHHLLFS
jgi:hypothetical protein